MIGYLKGKVIRLDPGLVLLEVNGVGYEIMTTGAAFSRLAGVKKGEEGEIYTYLQVKEDGISLFGFSEPEEKSLFLRLTSVQGVGAKMALAILSAMNFSEVGEAIAAKDSARLSAVKGVGKKTADRIILELHGKISAGELLGAGSAGRSAVSSEDGDAVSALMSLGFTKQESARAVARAKEAGARTVEEIVEAALRNM